MEEFRKYIGRKIREAREEKKITQEKLGEVLGYSPMGVSHFENGIRELKFSDLKQLADFFKKPISFFLPQAAPEITFFRVQDDNPEFIEALKRFEDYIKGNK